MRRLWKLCNSAGSCATRPFHGSMCGVIVTTPLFVADVVIRYEKVVTMKRKGIFIASALLFVGLIWFVSEARLDEPSEPFNGGRDESGHQVGRRFSGDDTLGTSGTLLGEGQGRRESEWDVRLAELRDGEDESEGMRGEQLMAMARDEAIPGEIREEALEYGLYLVDEGRFAGEVELFFEGRNPSDAEIDRVFEAMLDRGDRAHLESLLRIANRSGSVGARAIDQLTLIVRPESEIGRDWTLWMEAIQAYLRDDPGIGIRGQGRFDEGRQARFLKYRGLKGLDD
ncbi:MAG: hypothetical protein AAGD22_08500 [Verrucomicrobiota bacterium]